MIAKRKLTLARFFSLGTVALLLLFMLLLSKSNPLYLQSLNPAHLLPRLFHFSRPLSAFSGEKILVKQKTGPPKECALYTLGGKRRTSGGEQSEAECRRVLPVPGSCGVAETLFHSSPAASCSHQTSVEFCSLKSTPRVHSVHCSVKQCSSGLLGAAVDSNTGALQWKKFPSAQALETWINGLLHTSPGKRKHFGFCFIGCGTSRISIDEDLFDQQDGLDIFLPSKIQMLLLPPQVTSRRASHSPADSGINFNMIFIDSVSRQHFFRSLPNTVKLLEGLRQKNGSGVTVLDFELVQAVRSRTFETLQMLFSGQVDPSVIPFGVLELPPEPLKTEALLKTLKRRGYSTLWLEDLCYLWEWGLSKDLRVHNKTLTQQQTWENLQQALKQARIDSLEVTYAMCKVLNENGVADHFHGPDAVCFNGHHQHEYLLEYLELYQRTMVQARSPFFTFLETNVGHEDSGKRIQAFDPFFQRYLKNILNQQKNTLTVIFSDHGNSYGSFLEKSMEGRVELFHPHIFLLVPDHVARILGPAAMKALHDNQHRLVSHLDLHYTLQGLAHSFRNKVSEEHAQYQVSSKGLLSTVSLNRSCDHIPRIMPNLCICQNFDMPVESDSYHALFAHMALGKINNEIQAQFLKSKETAGQRTQGFGRCRRLVMDDFGHIRKSFSGATLSLKMDLFVPLDNTPNDVRQDVQDDFPATSKLMETFFVSMVVQLNNNNASRPSVILEKLDRITPYSKFSVCADPAVKLELCVCDVNSTQESRKGVEEKDSADFYLRSEVFVAEGTKECLRLIVKKNEHGGVFSVANVCRGRIFHVLFSLETAEMIVSDAAPQERSVFPRQELFLAMAVKIAPKAAWDWSFTLHHRQQSL
ncbi:hypothetical protein ACOMHN_017824 [Nucella lapillus]